MKNDLEIARSIPLRPIGEIARGAGFQDDEFEPYGRHKAKVSLGTLSRLKDRPNGRYVVVTAVTPTPLGEGKTVHTIGTALGLARLGKRAFTCLRQPSMGPLFGIKGGAAGGGYSQVVPMEEFNLHLTGDIHAVQAAHNLIAAHVDASLLLKNRFGFDPARVAWRRVVDVNDRALRDVLVGLGGEENGVPRRTGFDIAVASELMAILALADDVLDMRRRIGRVVLGYRRDGSPVTAEDAKCAGAAAAILKDAIRPTLMQTTEATPCFVHAGPFANIAHGNSSIVADRIALRLADYVVTEAGFGADIGGEKFFNVKCRASGLSPDAAVVVTTVRALKMHGGRGRIVPGKPLDPALDREDLAGIEAGIGNLEKQIENVRAHGIPAVVAINRYPSDTDREHDLVRKRSLSAGAFAAEVSEVFERGGEGGKSLAKSVEAACEKGGGKFRFLYPLDWPVKAKIEKIATSMYGADGVDYAPEADAEIAAVERLGFGSLPICMAKTHLSLTADPERKGRPKGFRLPVKTVRLSAGAGFLYPLCGEIKTMPGLGSRPGLENVDLDASGEIVGLF